MPSNRPYIPNHIRRQVEQDAQLRCGYCLTAQAFTAKALHIDHIIPIAAGGGSDIDNLWLACELCNGAKGMRTHAVDPVTNVTVPLFHPRLQSWYSHFRWSDNGVRILGVTVVGRATISVLKLNRPSLVQARTWWVKAGWHPPAE